ncbi:MAG: selenide, water dikinase SelD, partial [Anaerolineales bacterium]
WRLEEDRALVITTDFFTPIVDNPYDYGAIAAANSMSDVYAMGGKPFLALNIAAFPNDLPAEILSEVLRGGAEKALEAGVVVAGGHTIQDKEPKFGLIVLGLLHPGRMLTKTGARVGDLLVLSKPIGTGVITTAFKRDLAAPEDLKEAVEWMKRLNNFLAEMAEDVQLQGGTDITGFGLMGHAWEMASASGVGLRLSFEKIPFLQGAQRYAQEWIFPGGSIDNRAFYGQYVRFSADFEEAYQVLLFDAQTSGGLLLAVPPEKMEDLMQRSTERGQPLWVIGEVVESPGIEVSA